MSDLERRDDEAWLSEMLSADQDVPDVSADVESRMLARLGEALVAGDIGGDADADTTADGSTEGGDAGPSTTGDVPQVDPSAMASAAAPAAASGPSWTLLALACGVSAVLGSVAGYVAHDAVSAPSVSAPQPSSATAVIDGQTAEEPLPVVDAPATPAAVDPPAIDGADEVPAADSTRSGEPRPSANPRRGDASVAGVTRDESEPATAPVTEDVAGNAPTEAAARDEALADENALITRAQSALARGRAAEALTALREHQRRFPGGRFVEEREAMTIQAMARTGQVDAARTRAERFYARYPNSLLTRAVRAAVREP